MCLQAIHPKPRLSQGGPEHKIYPYLLNGLAIRRPNQVGARILTYIRLRHGFVFLVAIMDWFSRYVLAWEVSGDHGHVLLPISARPGAGPGELGRTSALRGDPFRCRLLLPQRLSRLDPKAAAGGAERRQEAHRHH